MNLELLRKTQAALKKFPVVALATIIQTWGSTPRKAGVKMVICPDGSILGTIGGGCSEGEVRTRARMVIDTEKAEIYQVSMLGDVAADEGMVCGGKMEVYIEPIFQDLKRG